MDYRDERDALRARQEALEQELTAARADAEGKATLQKQLAAKDKELARLRAAVEPRKGRGGRIALWILAGVGGLWVTSCGAMVWLRSSGRSLAPERVEATAPSVEPAAVTSAAPADSAAPAAPPLRFSLDSGGLAPLEKDASGADGVAAITFEDNGGARTYSAVLLSGSPLTERFRLGPYGARAPHIWTTGHRALIIDDQRQAHVIDTDNGREIAVVSGLADAPSRVCLRNGQAFITGLDEKSFGVNLETGAGSVGAKLMKAECSPLPDPKDAACRAISAPRCGGNAPSVPGFALKVAVAADRIAVGIGVKSPGTADVLAVGFDPKTRAIGWRMPIADDDEAEPLGSYPPIVAALDDDLFVAIERLHSGGSKLRAFEARSGARRFTYSFPETVHTPPLSIALGTDRIFTSSWGVLYVLDRTNGKEIARVGKF